MAMKEAEVQSVNGDKIVNAGRNGWCHPDAPRAMLEAHPARGPRLEHLATELRGMLIRTHFCPLLPTSAARKCLENRDLVVPSANG
jgi:hypothetical protein